MQKITRLNATAHSLTQASKILWYGGLATLMVRKFEGGDQRGGEKPARANRSVPLYKLRSHVKALYQADQDNVAAGLYPPEKPTNPAKMFAHIKMARKVLRDAEAVDERRHHNRRTEIRESPTLDTKRYPAYYQQNFHFQTDGWLSDESAEIYDAQVETLFLGTANLMRRAALAQVSLILSEQKSPTPHLLDIGCGNGRFMEMMADSWPNLRLTGLDLSPNYLAKAKKSLSKRRHIDLVAGMAESMPFEDNSFDVLLASYLFHELPPKIRKQVIAEAARVLKPNGHFIVSDSLQSGDTPELDTLLNYFPTRFHEPFFNSYITEDFATLFNARGFVQTKPITFAFLTKVTVWQLQDA